MKEISEHSKHIDALEQAIFGADYERFKQTLVLIQAMSKTARKFFLSRVNDFFTGGQGKPKKQGHVTTLGAPFPDDVMKEMAKRIQAMNYEPCLGNPVPSVVYHHAPAPDTPGSYDTTIADAAPVTWTAEEAFDEDHRGK